MEDDAPMKAQERMKSFTIFFRAKWMLDEKFKDVEWVRSYWNFKAELENAKSEIDEEEIEEEIAVTNENVDEHSTEGEVVHVEEDATIAIDEEVRQNIDD